MSQFFFLQKEFLCNTFKPLVEERISVVQLGEKKNNSIDRCAKNSKIEICIYHSVALIPGVYLPSAHGTHSIPILNGKKVPHIKYKKKM